MSTYARKYLTLLDALGNAEAAGTVEVRRESDNGVATLYADRAGLTPLSNPFTYNDDSGQAFFHVVGGLYKITITIGGNSKVLRYIGIGLAGETDFSPLGTVGYLPKYATTTTFGDSVIYDDGTNVGIGTASPGAKLEVAGEIWSKGGSVTAFMLGSSGDGVYIGARSNNFVQFRTNDTNRVRILATGEVGIGTTTPNARLSLGSLVAAAKLLVYDDGTYTDGFGIASGEFRIFNNSAGGTFMSFGKQTAGGTFTERMRIDSSGNVGVGTASPGSQTKLQVAGRGLFTGGSMDPGDSSPAGVAIAFASSIGYIQAIQTGVGNFPLRINHNGGDVSFCAGGNGGSVGVGVVPSWQLDVLDANTSHEVVAQFKGSASSGYAVARVTNGSHLVDLGVNSDHGIYIRAGDTVGGSGVAFQLSHNAGSTPLMTGLGNGNVGIGTAAPGGIFEVKKNATYSADTTAALRLSNASTAAKMIAAGYDGSLDAGYIQALHSGSAFKSLLLNPNGGNVGVGATSLNGQFSIQQASQAAGKALRIIKSGGEGNGYWDLWMDSNNVFNFNFLGGASVLAFSGNGTYGTNVGLGTSTPTQKLHVEGQIFVADGSSSRDPGDSSGPGMRIGYDTSGDYAYIFANQTGVAIKPLRLGSSDSYYLLLDTGVAVLNTSGNNNVKLGGSASRGTTESTNSLVLFNGTAAAGTLVNGVSLQSVSGVLRTTDAAGNIILLDTHLVHDNAAATLTKGFYETYYPNGTVSSGTLTPDAGNGNEQYATNGGAFTLAPPSATSSVGLEITNNGSAGAITTSGFTKVTGDAFTTTNGHKFYCVIKKTQTYSLLNVTALQ